MHHLLSKKQHKQSTRITPINIFRINESNRPYVSPNQGLLRDTAYYSRQSIKRNTNYYFENPITLRIGVIGQATRLTACNHQDVLLTTVSLNRSVKAPSIEETPS